MYAISSNIDKVLLISLSANVFVFEDFNVHRKDCKLELVTGDCD